MTENNIPQERCIVTILGQKYDFTEFKKFHPGGDLFKDGMDATRLFMSEHSKDELFDLEKFRVEEQAGVQRD